MTRAKWDELVAGGVASIANADYYKDVEETIAWADRVVKAAYKLERAIYVLMNMDGTIPSEVAVRNYRDAVDDVCETFRASLEAL